MIVTSGPTHEPIDPVRYIANRSSGKQGHAIAEAAAAAGANVTLVSGPVQIMPDPPGVNVVKVESARDMLAAVEKALPADVAVFAAAVADWRTADNSREKIKKTGKGTPELALVENPDILATVAHRKAKRPKLVIGFAAETEHVSSTPRRSSRARAATGSSPTTCRRKPASWAATATPSISSPRTASSTGRRSRRTRSPPR